jgi:plastocyanin
MKKMILAFLVLLGCGEAGVQEHSVSNENTAQPPPEADVEVVITSDFKFQPAVIRIRPQETIRWVNRTPHRHTVTTEEFSSGPIDPGQVFTFTFLFPGEIKYRSLTREDMSGLIIVQE